MSEEDQSLWAMRCRRLGIGPHARFMCKPFRGRRPTADEWRALADHLAGRRAAEGLDLVVVDRLATFRPGASESDPAALADLFGPLKEVAAGGVSVLVLHHPRKGSAAAGESARGGRAVGAFVDVNVELGWVGGAYADDRRRKLVAFSRYEETPRRLVIELSPDGTDYAPVGAAGVAELDDGWLLLLRVLAEAGQSLTRPQVLAGWSADWWRPAAATVWRWLDRAVADGRVVREGTGRSRDPFRYGLAGGMAVRFDPVGPRGE